MTRILIVEDNRDFAEALKYALEQQYYAVDIAYNGEEGEKLAENISYDGVLMDWMLPGKSGIEVLKSLRQKGIQTPTMITTGKAKAEDCVAGLDSGADDYLIKPFQMEEFFARVRALVRRKSGDKNPRLEAVNIVIDTASRQAWQDGREITLSAKEYTILEYLVRHHDTVVTRKSLELHGWNESLDSCSNTLDVHINRLRAKFDPEKRGLIHTVRGSGYRLNTKAD
jgi:two-component system, OmpR family, copper resistance phosphate regulon response regulator CusR